MGTHGHVHMHALMGCLQGGIGRSKQAMQTSRASTLQAEETASPRLRL